MQRFPKIKRRVSGYNLDQLLPENGFNVARALVGTEGTCVFTLGAQTRLVHSPQQRVLLVLGFPDIYLAGDAVPDILPFKPIATEGLDERIIGGLRERGLRGEDIALLPQGNAWIMIEFGAETVQAANAQATALVEVLRRQGKRPVIMADHRSGHVRTYLDHSRNRGFGNCADHTPGSARSGRGLGGCRSRSAEAGRLSARISGAR